MSLQYELFELSKSPQAHLSAADKAFFDFYESSIEQCARQGDLKCFILESTPESVLNSLTDSYNGYKILSDPESGNSYLDWSNPASKSKAKKMYDIASDPYERLSEIEKLEYRFLKNTCFTKAGVGEISIEIPENTSPKVLDALGIPKNTKFFYWGSPTTD